MSTSMERAVSMTLSSSNLGEKSSSSWSEKYPEPVYRRKKSKSCIPCRKRKSKCDPQEICASCILRGTQDDCIRSQKYTLDNNNYRRRSLASTTTPSQAASVPDEDEEEQMDSQSSSKNNNNNSNSNNFSDYSPRPRKRIQSSPSSLVLLERRRSSNTTLASFASTNSKGNNSINNRDCVTWNDLCHTLPSMTECEWLIDFYFDELTIYFRIDQRSYFQRKWFELCHAPGIKKIEAALILTSLALADLTRSDKPSNIHSRKKKHLGWMKMLFDPLSITQEYVDKDDLDACFKLVHLLTLQSIYHLYTGRMDLLWDYIGAAIRRGVPIGLFDERRLSWTGINELDKEYRRRLAWYIVTLDRLQAFARGLPFSLPASFVHLAEPCFEPDTRIQSSFASRAIVPRYPLVLADATLSTHTSACKPVVVKFVTAELVLACQDFMESISTMSKDEKHLRAIQVDQMLENSLAEGLQGTGLEYTSLQVSKGFHIGQCPKARQLEVCLWISTVSFMRCNIMRIFLLDQEAPPALRSEGLLQARVILGLIPSFERLVKDASTPIHTTWFAVHIITAASIFAAMSLGHDQYFDFQSSTSISFISPSMAQDFTGPSDRIEWIAYNIFKAIDCLAFLAQRGNSTASFGQKVLEKVCVAQPELSALHRQRYQDGGLQHQQQVTHSQQHSHHQQRHYPSSSSEQQSKALRLVTIPAPSMFGFDQDSGGDTGILTDSPITSASSQAAASLMQNLSATELLNVLLYDNPFSTSYDEL